MKKSIIFGFLATTLLNMDINTYELSEHGSLSLGFNQASAIERISIHGVKIPKRTYRANISKINIALSSINMDIRGDDSEARHREAKALEQEIMAFCEDLDATKPDSCNPLKKPTASVDGCSTSIFFDSWDNVFNSACNSHDRCYSTFNSGQSSCDDKFQRDMASTCQTT